MKQKIAFFSEDNKKFPFKKVKLFNDVKKLEKLTEELVVFDFAFFKKNYKTIQQKISEKVCFVFFDEENPQNLKILQRYSFFDYLTSNDPKELIDFKLKRAEKYFEILKATNYHLNPKPELERFQKYILLDPLVNCFNWKYFLIQAEQELNRAQRYLHPVSFIGIDIDYFRNINEIYGVEVADAIIKKLVLLIKRNLRKTDIVTRWRDDEFFIILPEQSEEDAYKIASRLRELISKYNFRYKMLNLKIKISSGVVTYPFYGLSNVRDIINALEKTIINAKQKGGNTTVVYSKLKPTAKFPQIQTSKVDELKEKIHKLYTILNRDILEMIYGFARAIEAKDAYTGKHLESTAHLAEKIARKLNLPPQEVEDVKRAAILHDLGKVAISETILSKKGKLTSKERKIIQTHPIVAAEILREIHGLRGAIPAILYHHERYDGKGYPFGLKKDQIPLGARIVAICDVYHALITNRPYRKALNKQKAIKIIKNESGKHFDPEIVKVFLNVISKS